MIPHKVVLTTTKTTNSIVTANMGMWDSDDSGISGRDRLPACLPYLLPLLDGDKYGRYIYQQLPPLKFVDQVLLGPLLSVYNALPFASIIFFFALTFGSRNGNFSRGIRFNAQQAILIDIALIFPDIVGSITPKGIMPQLLVEPATNFVYYAYVTCVIYSVVSNLTGKKPDGIPVISEAAEQGIGPM